MIVDRTAAPTTDTPEDNKLNTDYSYTGLTIRERARKISSIAAEGPYDLFTEVQQTTTKFLDAVYYFFKEELGFVDETIDEIKVTLKDKSTKTYTNIPVLKGNRNWMSESDTEDGDSNTLYIFYDIEKSPRVGFSYQARGKGGRLDYVTYLSGVHINEQGQIRNINPDPKITNDILKNRLKSFSVGSKGKGNKSNSRAAKAIISTDDAILEANTSLWELPAPTGNPDPSVHLIPNRTIIKELLTNGNKGKIYGYVTKSTWSYNKIDSDQTVEQHKIETWRKGDPKKQATPLKLQGGIFANRNLEELIKGGHRTSSKPFSSHTCFIPEIDDGNYNFHKSYINCPECYPDTVSNRPNDLKPYLYDDVATRLKTGDYCFYGIVVVNSEKTADIWRENGFLVIKLFGSETTAFHYFNEQQAELLAKLAYNRNIDIFVEVEKDPTGMDRLAHKLISSMVGPLVRHTLDNDKAPKYPSKTEIIAFTYHGDLKDKIDGEKAIASGLTVDQITTGLSQIKTNYIKAKQKETPKLTSEQKAALNNTPPVTQGMELCPNHIWLTYGIPGPCQKYIDATLEQIEVKDEKGNPKKKWVEKEGLTNQDKANACEHCYTNSVVRFNLLAKNIRHSHVGAFLPRNNDTKKLLERTRYHIKKPGIDFTSNFILRQFHNKGETESYFAFIPHNHKNGVTATAQAIDHQLQELLPSHIYAQLIEAGFQIQTLDTSPYMPEHNYLDNVCGRLVGEDGNILELSSFAKKGDLSTSVTIKGRKPQYYVLDEDGKPRVYANGKLQPCEFIDYDYGTNKHKLALEQLPSTLVYDFGHSLTQKLTSAISKQEIDIEPKAVYSLTEGSSTIYVRDLHDFNKVKIEYNKKRDNVIHSAAVDIATKMAVKDTPNAGKIFDTEYKSLIPGRGVSARYYSAEQAAASIPGLVFGEAAAKEMLKQISIAYQVNTNTAQLIYDKLEPIQRAHPNLLPDKVGLRNPDSTGLKDKIIYYPKTKVDKTKPPGA